MWARASESVPARLSQERMVPLWGFLFPPASPEARVPAGLPPVSAHSFPWVRLPAQKKARAAIVLVLIWYANCWISGFCRGFYGCAWFCGYRLKGNRRSFLWRWSFRCVSCRLPLQWLCGASGKQYGKQERAQHEILFHGMTSNDCFFSYCTNALGFLQLCRLYIFLLSWYCR